jgi:hypothetical protein
MGYLKHTREKGREVFLEKLRCKILKTTLKGYFGNFQKKWQMLKLRRQ